MKNILLFALIGFLSLPALAAETTAGTMINLKVSGLVCDICAQSIVKVFKKNENVSDVVVDLDASTVTITMKDETTLSDEELKKGIEYGGYDLLEIKR